MADIGDTSIHEMRMHFTQFQQTLKAHTYILRVSYYLPFDGSKPNSNLPTFLLAITSVSLYSPLPPNMYH